MSDLRDATHWLCDMDGVLIHDERAVPGASEFIDRLRERGRPLLVVTNNSLYEPKEISERLSALGLDVLAQEIWTSALATASFVSGQRAAARVFAIGRRAMHVALADAGCVRDDQAPDFVVLGETQEYSFDDFARAIQLIEGGAIFVSTNPEPTGPSPRGSLPGCGAMAALVERATGVAPYVVGKPNPFMIREALSRLGAEPRHSVLVGDRVETDVLVGAAAGVTTVMVLSGVGTLDQARRAPVRPDLVVGSVSDLLEQV
ncbi:MAG: HAD-IIA family hydrolase [Acidimicrobiales bacterium]